MRLNHLAFVTMDLAQAVDAYLLMGFEKAHDDVRHHVPKNMLIQRVRLGESIIEFLQVADPSRPSFAAVTPDARTEAIAFHHVCYDVEDIHRKVDELLATGEYAIHEPITGGVFQKNQLCFLRHKFIGLIELLEWPKD